MVPVGPAITDEEVAICLRVRSLNYSGESTPNHPDYPRWYVVNRPKVSRELNLEIWVY